MNFLARFRLGSFVDGLSLLRRGRSTRLRSGLAPSAADPSARGPSWVFLNSLGLRRDDSSVVADPKTVAESQTSSTGRSKDSILIEVDRRGSPMENDYFVYRAAGASRPPSLSLLPARNEHSRKRRLHTVDPGLLRRGDGELIVVQFEHMNAGNGPDPKHSADLSVLNLRTHEWEMKQAVPIVAKYGAKEQWLSWLEGGTMECPKLRYMPMHMKPHQRYGHYDDGYVPDMMYTRTLCCGCRKITANTVAAAENTVAAAEEITANNVAAAKQRDKHADSEVTRAFHVCIHCTLSCSDNPDIVCFSVHEKRKIWKVEVDMRAKSVLSVVCCSACRKEDYPHLPAKFLC
ncbi:hypothetical protein EJB05_29076, partial [Eragrostis curvula]